MLQALCVAAVGSLLRAQCARVRLGVCRRRICADGVAFIRFALVVCVRRVMFWALCWGGSSDARIRPFIYSHVRCTTRAVDVI